MCAEERTSEISRRGEGLRGSTESGTPTARKAASVGRRRTPAAERRRSGETASGRQAQRTVRAAVSEPESVRLTAGQRTSDQAQTEATLCGERTRCPFPLRRPQKGKGAVGAVCPPGSGETASEARPSRSREGQSAETSRWIVFGALPPKGKRSAPLLHGSTERGTQERRQPQTERSGGDREAERRREDSNPTPSCLRVRLGACRRAKRSGDGCRRGNYGGKPDCYPSVVDIPSQSDIMLSVVSLFRRYQT